MDLEGSGSFVPTFPEILKKVFLQIYQSEYSSAAITNWLIYH